jgi:hypothetical protein
MSLETDIEGIFKKVAAFFGSSKVKTVETDIANILPIALQYVQEADTFLGGNKTLENIIALVTKWGLPAAAAINSTDPNALNNLLMNTVTTVVQKNLPPAQSGAALSIINAAVNSAVALAHA